MASTPLDASFAARRHDRRLYAAAAVVAALVVFAGFAPTYYLKGVYGAPELSALKHLHGVLMTLWFALFIAQVSLVATGRTPVHRQLGVYGVILAACLVVVGTQLGIASARAGVTPLPGLSPLVFLVMPIGEVVVFVALFTAAILLRKRAAHHKRLMLLATLAMLTPAVARLPFDFIKAGGPPAFFAVTDLVILGCIAFDTVRNRRLHPAFAVGFVVVVVGQVGRLAFSQTTAWMQFARWLVG